MSQQYAVERLLDLILFLCLCLCTYVIKSEIYKCVCTRVRAPACTPALTAIPL